MALITKRNGSKVEFDKSKIVRAIEKAMMETDIGVDSILSNKISDDIEILASENEYTVEQISDIVEELLASSGRFDASKKYILYRDERKRERLIEKPKYKFFTNEFLSTYKHAINPMTELGSFVYSRTYSRYLPEEKRREYWWETIARAVDYNCSLSPLTTKEEAEKLFDNIFNLKQFLSGRTFWVGGTEVSRQYPMSNYNCSFTIIDNFNSFKDLFYLLMIGAGVGVRILKSDVEKLPPIRSNVEIIHKDYVPVSKRDRKESTAIDFEDNMVEITVADSKEGWTQSLDFFLKILYAHEYRKIQTVIMNYDNVRPKGEKLNTFGGTASGHESIKAMFEKIDKIIKRENVDTLKLRPIHCLDIANIIGENVVVGGVRRTSEIMLIDADDKECVEAKSNLYNLINGDWKVNKDLVHRQMSNNSIYYKEKPSRDQLHWQIEQMRYSGEPAWINEIAASKRRINFNGVNPCGEILLDNNGLCNLTTVNVFGFVRDGKLDKKSLLEAQRLSARAGYRMTIPTLELPHWNTVQQRDKLIGCSLTGWQDMVNATNMSKEDERILLQELKNVAIDEAETYAKHHGTNVPLLVTTLKPEGTLSQLPTVSSGVHYSHSPYYVRRVRVNAADPIVKVCEELKYPVFPEVGQTMENCTTKIVEFPVKSPDGKTKYDVSAIEQLENYKLFMDEYVQHNCSITVHVKNNEWDDVEQWVWDNWEDVVAVSFLSLDDSFYQLMPYESITEEEYNERKSKMKPFSQNLISKYEIEQVDDVDVVDDGCASGACPIR